ncbi:MAG: hypothetical protein QM645_04730 [Asticcacaulis sp.]
MSIATSLIELLLARHHIKSSRPYALEAMGAVAGLAALMMFAASALSLLLFVALWMSYRVMTVAGLSDLSAALFVCVGIVLIAVAVVWAMNKLRLTLMRAFNQLIKANTTVPGQETLTGVVSRTAKVAGAFRNGLMQSGKATRRRGEPHPAAKA